MAANIIEPGSALADLASTLDLSQVPDKLHCSMCQQFLINAYRTTCCESCVCDKCFDRLEDQCPICTHKPFSKDLVRPNKAMRGTAKAYLKGIEKAQAEERAKRQASGTPVSAGVAANRADVDNIAGTPSSEPLPTVAPTNHTNGTAQEASLSADVQPSVEEGFTASHELEEVALASPVDDERLRREYSNSSDGNDDEDEVEIQVEPADGEDYAIQSAQLETFDEELNYTNPKMEDSVEIGGENNGQDQNAKANFGMANMGMNFNLNMQPMQMMQQMQQMMMSNPMMGAMGLNPSMFGGFQNGGMNGMDMSMMGFANQNFGWNGPSNNNFNNAYSNGMGSNFGPQFGFDMSQQGSFQQQFQNGDFQSGFSDYRGRGRGRYRGGRGSFRGRGHFNQYSQNGSHSSQNMYDSQDQHDMQAAQAHTHDSRNTNAVDMQDDANQKVEDHDHGTDDFAPGGQGEVQEALGDRYSSVKEEDAVMTPVSGHPESERPDNDGEVSQPNLNGSSERTLTPLIVTNDKTIPDAYHEDLETMAPPTAPLGPSGRYNDTDSNARVRGRGRFGHMGRGSFPIRETHPVSPIKPVSQASPITQSPTGKGLGVQGAPTGPRAMREPVPSKTNSFPNGTGFQIRGQAAAQSQAHTRGEERPRSPSIENGRDSHDERLSRRLTRQLEPRSSLNSAEQEVGHGRADKGNDRRGSGRTKGDDFETGNGDANQSGAASQERKSSRSGRREREKERDRDRDKDRHSSRYRSSRRAHDDGAEGDYDMDDYEDPVESRSSQHRSSHRRGRSSGRQEGRDRDRARDRNRDREREQARERERERERDRDRERERERDRESHRTRDKEKEDRHRKRSRHERDRDDDYDDADEEESRHRSRRHKKEHNGTGRRERGRDRDQELDEEVGLRISGHSSSARNTAASALPTPTSAVSGHSEPEKDPHTLEREARNRERMLKEQQRREKAAAEKRGPSSSKHNRSTVSGGRRVSYKYEDEVERGMDDGERRWR